MERCRFPCGTACGTARRTPFSARIAEKLGAKVLITAGLVLMTAGLVILAVLPSSAPVQALAAVMVLVGLGGPLVMPPLTAVLLNSVPPYRAGVASGVFNTSRQVGGALAVAVFGALLANRASFAPGVRASLLIAAAVALAAAAASLLLRTAGRPPMLLTRERDKGMAQDKEPSGAQKLFGDFPPALADFTDDVLFGQVWTRPELAPRERSLVTVAALTTSGNTGQLVYHLGLAGQNGATEAELIEAITHLAF